MDLIKTKHVTNRGQSYLVFIVSDSVADQDPGSGAFLTPGSGMEKKSDPDPGGGIHPRSFFPELRNSFLG
jgi:hypothetical protein